LAHFYEFFRGLFNADQLQHLLQNWGWVAYIVLVAIVFAESGLFFGFFLPGDSLLFIAGFVCSLGSSNLQYLYLAPVLAIAAIAGDSAGYWFGRKTGPLIFRREDSLFFRRSHLMKAHDFYERHGGLTIIYARFVPIVRTFAPIVAGAGEMNYKRFLMYNVCGGIGWVFFIMGLGYFLGSVEWVKHNLEKAVMLVIALSLLPIALEFLKSHLRGRASSEPER